MGISALLAAQILDASATGRSVLTGADASAIRTTLGLGTSATLNAGSANGVATLDALGKLASAQIPDISLISYLGSVASQAAMLALSGQQGDWCVRSDLSTTWVITGSDPTLLANWTQLSYPSVPVQSVFGRTGNVVGVSTDYSSVGITNTAIGASNPSTGAFTTLSANSATLSAGTLNGTVLDITQTWGGTGTYTGLKYNVTDSGPSNAASLLMDLQVGGSSQFSISKVGAIAILNPGRTSAQITRSSIRIGQESGSQYGYITSDGTLGMSMRWNSTNGNGVAFASTSFIPTANGGMSIGTEGYAWSRLLLSVSTDTCFLYPDAPRTLALRDGVNANTLRIYNTFTDASNYERAKIAWESNVLVIGTEAGGTGTGQDIRIRTNSGNNLTLTNGGNLIMNSGLWLSWSSRVILESPGFGILRISDSNRTGFERLQLGGTTSSFPAIKRNSTALNFRLADDSADCDITAKAATFSGNVTISAVNIVTDTTTGTKIGTATTQKLGFYNATPVVQPTAVADATDAASVITQLNALLSRMRDLGLIAT